MLEELNNPIYSAAFSRLQRNRNIQFEKAADKYPKTLNPFDWTPQQLGDHLAQEVIDTLHYSESLVYIAQIGFEGIKLLEELHDNVIRFRMVGDSPELKEITNDISKFFQYMKGGE